MAKLLFDHFVVLMLENRSFDHLFGYLGKGEGIPAGGASNRRKPDDPTSKKFSASKGGDYVAIGDGPSHSLAQTNKQLFGEKSPSAAEQAASAPLNGFVASFQGTLFGKLGRNPTDNELQQVMNCFDPVQLPVLSTLAKEFVLCDHWFADVPGPTMPNRAYVHAATSQGYTWNAHWEPNFTCKTLYDRINADPTRSWRSYVHDTDDLVTLYPNLGKKESNHAQFEGNFLNDVAGDKLATYSFINPAFFPETGHPVNSMHAPQDVRPAEKLVADVYNALRAHPNVWKKTLFIVVFDEHGGYFDHVPPPATVSPDNIDGIVDQDFLVPFNFKRLGLRVPAILISPWFQPGLDSTVYSHSTIPGSVIDALNLPGGFLTERDKKANKLTNKYLVDDGTHVWRTTTPDLTVPIQPQPLDMMARELLDSSVNLDPHPENRSMLRTRDIQDPAHAKKFIRTQMAKHLEHYFASKGQPELASQLTTEGQPASTFVSPSRIADLRNSPNRKPLGEIP